MVDEDKYKLLGTEEEKAKLNPVLRELPMNFGDNHVVVKDKEGTIWIEPYSEDVTLHPTANDDLGYLAFKGINLTNYTLSLRYKGHQITVKLKKDST